MNPLVRDQLGALQAVGLLLNFSITLFNTFEKALRCFNPGIGLIIPV